MSMSGVIALIVMQKAHYDTSCQQSRALYDSGLTHYPEIVTSGCIVSALNTIPIRTGIKPAVSFPGLRKGSIIFLYIIESGSGPSGQWGLKGYFRLLKFKPRFGTVVY